MTAVYIGQFDAIWKLTHQQWLGGCASGAAGLGYDLTPFHRLKSRPRFLHRDDEERGRFWCSHHDVRYFEPLDWYPEDFAEHLEERAATSAGEESAPA